MGHLASRPVLLLIDTCGDGAGVALSRAGRVVADAELPRGGGSAEIVGAMQRALAAAGCTLDELDAVAVVSGPGSFTGVRVGMAAAKGLAEALQIGLLTLSRLEVLAVAADVGDGWVALDAGRSGLYAAPVHGGHCGHEALFDLNALRAAATNGPVAVAEERVAARLLGHAPQSTIRLRTLRVGDALMPALDAYRSAAPTPPDADANYLARADDIYKAKAAADRPREGRSGA